MSSIAVKDVGEIEKKSFKFGEINFTTKTKIQVMSNFLAEIVGTMILIILGGGVVAGVVLKGSKSENAGWIVITVGWGLAVAMGVYAVGQISGAHLNPAVTVAVAIRGGLSWGEVPAYILAQMIGAFAGAVLVWAHFMPHWGQTEDQGAKLGVFATGPAIRSFWPNLLSETIGTFVLILGLLFIGVNKFADGVNPLVVGGLVLAIGLSLGGTTGYAINPARDLGPRIAHFVLPIPGKGDSDWGYAAVPVLGPIFGAVLGATVYSWLFEGKVSVLLWVALLGFVGMIFLAYSAKKG